MPLVDFEESTNYLDIFHEIPGRVFLQRSARSGLPSSSLVEEYNLIFLGIKKSSVRWASTSPGSAVKEHNWSTILVTTQFIIQGM